MHYYRLTLTDPKDHEELNDLLTAPVEPVVTVERETMSEAAKALPVPKWWKGGTTASSATLMASRMKEGKTP